jgi:hypothetical protein
MTANYEFKASALSHRRRLATMAHCFPGVISRAKPDTPHHLGLHAEEEVLVTFSGEVADRHPPTAASPENQATMAKLTEGVRLLTWGDPLLEAWLEATRGAPLTDADYKVSGLTRDADPFTS